MLAGFCAGGVLESAGNGLLLFDFGRCEIKCEVEYTGGSYMMAASRRRVMEFTFNRLR
jgi:hypothetical protein